MALLATQKDAAFRNTSQQGTERDNKVTIGEESRMNVGVIRGAAVPGKRKDGHKEHAASESYDLCPLLAPCSQRYRKYAGHHSCEKNPH